jgi:hypothetical protein
MDFVFSYTRNPAQHKGKSWFRCGVPGYIKTPTKVRLWEFVLGVS